MFSHCAPPFFIETYAFSCSVILPGQLIRKWLQERSILQPLYTCLCCPALKITPTELFQISETDFSPGGNFQVTWSPKKSCGHSRAVSPQEKMPAWQMYIFLSVFSVYHDTGDDKRPGKHLHNRISLPGLSDLYNSSGHIHPVYFLPLSEFHIMILFRYCSLGYMRCYLIIFLRIPAFFSRILYQLSCRTIKIIHDIFADIRIFLIYL